ncbi:MAG: flippase-like domain-containing protein, partial [Deltaproteobacteria bacterium]|nr:flippase-like domain-containing protein [Deltaproteobacteria bacterium]
LLAPAGCFLLHALGWLVLFPGPRPRLFVAFRTYVASQALDELGAGVLGEPLKVLAAPGGDRDAGLVAMALDNLALLGSLVLFLAVAAGGIAAWGAPGTTLRVAGGMALALAAGGGVVALLLAGPGALGDRLAARRPGGCIAALVSGHRRLARGSRAFLRDHPWRFLGSAGLHLGARLWVVGEVWVTLHLLGVADLEGALALSVGHQAVQVAGAPVPAQVGALEGTLAAVGEGLGLTPPVALAVALLRRGRSLSWIALGLALARGAGERPAPPQSA